MFYRLRPAVPGGLGDGTTLDTTVHPPRVEGTLYYEIDDWFGDDLITSFPCFVVTETMAASLTSSGLGSFEIRNVEIVYGSHGGAVMCGSKGAVDLDPPNIARMYDYFLGGSANFAADITKNEIHSLDNLRGIQRS